MRQYRLREMYQIAINKGLIDSSIKYMDFYTIVREFNQAIAQKIIFNHYKFSFGTGTLEVIKDIRRGKSIDWNASKKLKQAYIDRDMVPYDKETAPNGHKWFIYFEGENYFKWHWFKDKSCEFVKNLKYYIFKPMTKNRKLVGKAIKENPFADLDYGLHK